MKIFGRLVAAAGVATAIASPAAAASLYGGNGHYYDFVSTGLSWQDALAASAAATPMAGFTAHLVTITDAGEDAFVKALTGNATYVWAAGTDEMTEGTWKWAAGPEAGQTFYIVGAAIQPGYSNWNGGEPNDAGGNEDFLHFKANGPQNWNDIYATFGTGGYVVEYSPDAVGGVPEPASWALMIGGFGMAGAAMRRRRSTTVRFA